jgi:hypothetical protein
MLNWKQFKMRILILSLIILLVGCSTIKPINDQIIIHPELPRPISSLQIDWDVIELNQDLYIGTEYNSFLLLLEHQSDLIRYIEQTNKSICFYRKELNENFCLQKENSVVE